VAPFYRYQHRHGEKEEEERSKEHSDGNDDCGDGDWANLLSRAYAHGFALAFRDDDDDDADVSLDGIGVALRDDGRRKDPFFPPWKRKAVDVLICPLLGAGARGAPVERAVRVAAASASRWLNEDEEDADARRCRSRGIDRTICFGILEESHADLLVESLLDEEEKRWKKVDDEDEDEEDFCNK